VTEPYVPDTVPAHLREDVASLLGNRSHFCQMLRIKHKQLQKFVPFEPNAAQRRLWELMDETNRVIVIKARQVASRRQCVPGSSTGRTPAPTR